MTPIGSKRLLPAMILSTALASTGLSSAPGAGIHCSLVQLKDNQRSNTVAFTYCVPNGWKSESSFNWNGNTYVALMSAMTPDKHYLVDRLEPMNTTYAASSGTLTRGIKLTNATDFLHALVQRLTQEAGVTNVRVAEEYNTDLPLSDSQKLMQNARQIGGMSQTLFRRQGFLQVQFDRDGTPETAGMGTTVEGYISANNMQLGIGQTARQFASENDTYIVGPTVVVETPASPSPEGVKEAQVVASSTRMTPQFATFCAQLALQMSIDAYKRTQKQGEELIQEMREHTAKIIDDYKARWADRDKTTHDFCNYILDQQDYKSSDGSLVTLPAYYNHAWSNGQGQYILTDDPTFDPRGTDGSTWENLQKSIHGG